MLSISLITSLYRSEKHLPAFLIRSKNLHEKLRKEGISFEHILVLNDKTQIEQDLLQSVKNNFVVIETERESIYASWNRGIRVSKKDCITPWNVDDIRFPKAIVDGLTLLDRQPEIDAVYFPFVYLRFIYLFGLKFLAKIKIFFPPKYEKKRFITEMHAGPFFIVRKNSFDSLGYFDPTYKISGDYAWWSHSARNGMKAKMISTISGIFTNDGRTLSGSRSTLQQEENIRTQH